MNNIDFDWDDVRVFLTVAEQLSLSRAAETLNLSQPTVGRHISRLEDQLEVRLFDRRQTGYVLTEAGQRLTEMARTMARGAADFARAVDLEKTEAKEKVCRITLGEWGQHFLAQQMAEITAGLDNVRLELFADDAFWDLSRNTADIAIGNRLPKHPHLITQKLGDISFHVYATDSYLTQHPDAYDRATWATQVWVGYCGNRAKLQSSRLLNEILDGNPCQFAVTNSLALLGLLKSGQAMAVLPDWIASTEKLQRLTEAPLARGDAWMSFHERLRLDPTLANIKDRVASSYRRHFAKVAKSG